MHSPVLINYDPGFIDDYSGWEYETDDYYDGDGPDSADTAQSQSQTLTGKKAASSSTRGKRKRADSAHRKRKRRRQDGTQEDIPELDLDESDVNETTIQTFMRPLVVWRNEEERGKAKVPLLKDGEGTKVSVLKDWRERLGLMEGPTTNGSKVRFEDGSSVGRKKASRPTQNLVKMDQDTRNVKKRMRENEVEEIDVHYSASSDKEESTTLLSSKLNSSKRTDVQAGNNDEAKRYCGKIEGKMLATHARKSKRLRNG